MDRPGTGTRSGQVVAPRDVLADLRTSWENFTAELPKAALSNCRDSLVSLEKAIAAEDYGVATRHFGSFHECWEKYRDDVPANVRGKIEPKIDALRNTIEGFAH